MAKIGIIVGTTRQGRATDKLAKWVAVQAAKNEGTEVEVVDLVDYPLPFFDEQIPPRYNPGREAAPEVQMWLDKIAELDGYVVVTAEYNRSMPGVLKNALDTLGNEMLDKPVAIVAHGSTGGAQAVASLRITLPGNGAVSVPNALFFTDRVNEAIDDEGIISAELQDGPYSPQASLDAALASLVWYTDALKIAK